LTSDDDGEAQSAVIRVRLFAALRELADAGALEAEGRTVGEVVDAVSSGRGDRFEQIAAVSSFVVNGERAARSTPLADGDEVAILPPVSGGAERSQERSSGTLRARSGNTCDTPTIFP
jgi:MoaD family protein